MWRIFVAQNRAATRLFGLAYAVVENGVRIREDAKHIIQPFFSTRSIKGAGLGLWTSKGIIRKYGAECSQETERRRIHARSNDVSKIAGAVYRSRQPDERAA